MGAELASHGHTGYLIALPERALADRIRDDRKGEGRTQMEIERYLFENLRMDINEVRSLNANLLEELGTVLRSRKVRLCAALVRNLRRKNDRTKSMSKKTQTG